jgi:hypothetical protein
MENVQTILVVVVIALTVLLLVVGVQVIMIIMDLRRALKRLNSLLDDSILGGGLIQPNKLTGILEMVKKGKGLKSHGSGEDLVQ